jgi:hypothetical protein
MKCFNSGGLSFIGHGKRGDERGMERRGVDLARGNLTGKWREA